MTTRADIQAKIDNLNKPKGSLGRLETLAMQICTIQNTLEPSLSHPCHVLFGGDHGIQREGVSPTPREVTWQQMLNYGRGGGGINMFCRQHGFSLRIVDVGVDYDFHGPEAAHIIPRKIAHGTRNFLYHPAMSPQQWQQALSVGAEQVEKCHAEGCNVISFGEMGVANTSPSSILMHLLLNIPLEQCVGAGSGLDEEGVRRKYQTLKRAVERHAAHHHDAESIAACYCGFEMAAAVGAMLEAARRRMVILVDGFIMGACFLVARALCEEVTDYAVFGHCGDEGGHRLMLEAIGASPLLHLDMRLGEGTGAVCAYPLLQSAVGMMVEMDNFAHAAITKYF